MILSRLTGFGFHSSLAPGIESGTRERGLVQSRALSAANPAASEWRRGRWRKVSSSLVTVHRSTVVNRLQAVIMALDSDDVDTARRDVAQLVALFENDPRRARAPEGIDDVG